MSSPSPSGSPATAGPLRLLLSLSLLLLARASTAPPTDTPSASAYTEYACQYLSGYNDIRMEKTLAECQVACSSNPWCLTIDYTNGKDICALSFTQVPESELGTSSTCKYSHYVKKPDSAPSPPTDDAGATAFAALDAALLHDILEAYSEPDDGRPAACRAPADATATTFSFTWPGTYYASRWRDAYVGFEEDLFQASLTHTDAAGDDSWTIRIGTGGNMYSHVVRDRHGETMASQDHDMAPWIDEVQQCVAVNLPLNVEATPYFIHQAGAYQKDGANTAVPFYSPSLAKHCEANWCAFASWGTQAHLPTPYTSPTAYINRYADCGGGVLEHTQMIHNFADPTASSSADVDQRYFNVGWGGVRASTLPYALEPDASDTLKYSDVNDVGLLSLCPWGGVNFHGDAPPDHDGKGKSAWKGMREDLKDLGGYTTFTDARLLVNQAIAPPKTWCRIEAISCYTDSNGCMEPCTDAQVQAGTHTRMPLKVAANSSPNCKFHVWWNEMVSLQCNLRDTGFGATTPYLAGGEACSPWSNVGFVNTNTNKVLPVAFVRHWSNSPSNKRVYFALNTEKQGGDDDENTRIKQEAIDLVNGMFNNAGNDEELLIDLQGTTFDGTVPTDYDPGTHSAFTYIYGKGEAHDAGLGGRSRRRVGYSQRDYTVFTINWHGATLQAGSTFRNRGFFLSGALGSAAATAGPLADATAADEIAPERWDPRAVDAYGSGGHFAVVAAAAARGGATTCGGAVPACRGGSTPGPGRVPFFYVTCGAATYFGPNPYHFAPDFGGSFPGHGAATVRSYVCDGEVDAEGAAVRPSWKWMGFFDPITCTSLETAVHDEGTFTCAATDSATESPTDAPTDSPTESPTESPTDAPTDSPSGDASTESPTDAPTDAPTDSPSDSATSAPKLTVTLPSEISLQGFDDPQTDAELARVANIVGPPIAASVKQNLEGDQDVTVEVTSINGKTVPSGAGSSAARRLVSRGLQDSLTCAFDIVLSVTCATSVCSDQTTQVDDLVQSVTDSFQGEVYTDAFANALKQSANEAGLTLSIKTTPASLTFSEATVETPTAPPTDSPTDSPTIENSCVHHSDCEGEDQCKGHWNKNKRCRKMKKDCKLFGTKSKGRWGCRNGKTCTPQSDNKWGKCKRPKIGQSMG